MNDSKNFYLDANFLVSLLIDIHPFYERARRINLDISQSRKFISFLVIDELLHSLGYYMQNKKDIAAIVSNLVEESDLRICEHILSKESFDIDNYLGTWIDSGLRPRDAMHLYLVRSLKLDGIVSLDSDFIKNADQLGIEVIS